MASNHIFKIMFVNQGKVYEVYARKVSHGSLFGFVEIEELVFGERSSVVVDPGEERSRRIRGRQAQLPAAALGHPHRRGAQAGRQQDRARSRARNVAQFPMPLLPPSAMDPGSKKT